ncbi:MAG: hypothetical protein ACLP9L_27205 [Thermoguttaceae bacterium]
MHERRSRHLLLTLALATLVAQGGCTWLRRWNLVQEPPPQILPPGAGLEQVIAAVNRNNSQIQALFSNSATLSGPGYPTLRAHIAFQRQRNFRLKADGFGPEVDLGSNDQIFWFWIKRYQPPGVYFCRHDRFATSPARQMIPIDPNWLIEALGTLEIDPALPSQGPYPDKGNRIFIRTMRETPEGPNMKVTIIDSVSAWVMEQQIYDAQGRLRARSVAERYRPDPRTGLYVPTAVRVECPEVGFSMRIDLGAVQVNQPQGNPAELWSMPSYPGFPPVDLSSPNMPYGPPPGTPARL